MSLEATLITSEPLTGAVQTYMPTGCMYASVYDPQNMKTDIFSYHDSTKQDILTDEDKQTIADLHSDTITSVNEKTGDVVLDADDLQYDSTAATHATGSIGEELKLQSETINGKQETIDDLADIRSGAALGATALQSIPSTYRTAAEQDTIHDETKQDKLVPGDGILIGEDGKTISVIGSVYSFIINVNLSTNDGGSFVSVVSLYDASGLLVSQQMCSGTTVTFTEPGNFAYTLKFSTPSGYSNVDDVTLTLTNNITVTKVFKAQYVYGFHINGGESDPSSMVTYLEKAVGMAPAYMDFTSGSFNWGSWSNVFFIPRPCMLKYDGTVDYYLDNNDYTKREDGTTSDIADTSYEGNAMMEWGQNESIIWLKVVPDDGDNNSASVYIANVQLDEGYHAYSFINSNGEMVNHFYTPIYVGSLVGSKLRSISGQITSQGKNGVDEISEAKENGTGWYTEFNCDITLINYLLILMCKSTDLQNAYGFGRCGYSAASSGITTTGLMDDKGMFWGQDVHDGTETGVKVFGMENFWGSQWRRFAGLINVNGNLKYKLCYGKTDGSTTDDYNTTGDGYVSSGIKLSGTDGGYINKMIFAADGSMNPGTALGSSSTYYCDCLCYDNKQVEYASRGGSYNLKLMVGPLAFNLNAMVSSGNNTIVAALSYKPV